MRNVRYVVRRLKIQVCYTVQRIKKIIILLVFQINQKLNTIQNKQLKSNSISSKRKPDKHVNAQNSLPNSTMNVKMDTSSSSTSFVMSSIDLKIIIKCTI